ncbi:MAG: hypothetical protein H6713_04015 [Myxococcales bacterium]|nr:hypothetical protein [Myxococcales bacterium]
MTLAISACASARLKRALDEEWKDIEDVSLTEVLYTRTCRAGRAHFQGERQYSPHEPPERLCGIVCCKTRDECSVTDFRCSE